MPEVKLTRDDKPERSWIENPLKWWGDTPYGWNFKVPTWNGSGEIEALCELFFDNLATLLSVTGAAVNTIGYGITAGGSSPGDYRYIVAEEWERIYFTRNIPGCAFALLAGNVYYAWQCGRLGAKEGRSDVCAQPYGMNTTGIFILLFALQLPALLENAAKYEGEAAAAVLAGGTPNAAAYKAAEAAWKLSVKCNFIMGFFECFGAFMGEAIRKVTPTAAFYCPLMGVGFVYLAFTPMLAVAAEPIMCWLPLIIVMIGFFGGVRYALPGKLSVPIALLAIGAATIFGWAGACKKHDQGMVNYGYTLRYGDSDKWVTCSGTSRDAMELAYDKFAFNEDTLKDSIFVGIFGDGWGDVSDFVTSLFLVAAVSFCGTMACVESASAAGDDYPMAETMIVDGLGTVAGSLFGSFYSTTVYIGHPIHKNLGASRGYSMLNGLIYFIILLSGLFAVIYNMIPGCANGAILIFVGLLLGRQAFEETPSRHYPALIMCVFPFICNYLKNSSSGVGTDAQGILMMGQAGGLLFSFMTTWTFCVCIDRKFLEATILALVAIPMSLFGFFASWNAVAEDGKWGPEKLGVYIIRDDATTDDGLPKTQDDNNGWRWCIAWGLAAACFMVHVGLQQIGYIEGPIDESGEGRDSTTSDGEKPGKLKLQSIVPVDNEEPAPEAPA
mmetsp:Transcript_62935/g.116996  ORF Transcript_62935/g.116996 Transcript_62935/m.116996 type:complete len:668 (+) Transcript_62935:65-2068(+)